MSDAASKIPESVSNPYNFYVDVIISLLEGNTETTMSHAEELHILTQTSESLSSAWTTTPSAADQSALTQQIETALAGVNGSSSMGTFITTYLTDGYLDGFSSELGIQVMTTLSNPNNWDSSSGSSSPGQMNIINQWNSLITSKAQNEESLGQNDTKTESSVVQQDAGAQQVFADMGNSVSGIVGNYASLLQQAY